MLKKFLEDFKKKFKQLWKCSELSLRLENEKPRERESIHPILSGQRVTFVPWSLRSPTALLELDMAFELCPEYNRFSYAEGKAM